MKKRCDKCVYWQNIVEVRGECRFNPPHFSRDKNGYAFGVWPDVKAEDWCGKFKCEDEHFAGVI